MKVLVTGGTGYLGRAVVSALAARGHDVVIFARSASRSGLPGAAIDGDIRDRAAVERAAAGCDAISHAAALVSMMMAVSFPRIEYIKAALMAGRKPFYGWSWAHSSVATRPWAGFNR